MSDRCARRYSPHSAKSGSRPPPSTISPAPTRCWRTRRIWRSSTCCSRAATASSWRGRSASGASCRSSSSLRETLWPIASPAELGADDYLVKPFALEELMARVRAVLRRRGAIPQVLEAEQLLVDEEHGFAARAGNELALTSTELRLLAFLMRHRGQALSKDQLLTQVWGYDAYDHNLVEVHISALRRKLEATGPRLIHTVRGIGYRFSP
jgi:DNA-binding winged helix-turn-helix (wHTH) protein